MLGTAHPWTSLTASPAPPWGLASRRTEKVPELAACPGAQPRSSELFPPDAPFQAEQLLPQTCGSRAFPSRSPWPGAPPSILGAAALLHRWRAEVGLAAVERLLGEALPSREVMATPGPKEMRDGLPTARSTISSHSICVASSLLRTDILAPQGSASI